MNRKSMLVVLVAIGMTGIGLVGCDEGADRDSVESSEAQEASDDPAARARANSDEGAAALAESDKGVDEEGEKTWKQDAREYYDFAKNPKNRTFEMPVTFARELTAKLYAAGADRVWVTRITSTEIGDTTINMSDDLLIVLPADPTKRKAVFAVHQAAFEDAEMHFPDVGQKYIHIVAD